MPLVFDQYRGCGDNLVESVVAYKVIGHDVLDTHPEDKKAFRIFQDLVKKTNELKCEYLVINRGEIEVWIFRECEIALILKQLSSLKRRYRVTAEGVVVFIVLPKYFMEE